jgi:hypothetical protein
MSDKEKGKGKGKRGASKCKKKFLAPDQFTVQFDASGVAIGENAASFMSWVGVEFKKKIPYDKVAKDVDSKLYDEIWEYTKVLYSFFFLLNLKDSKSNKICKNHT